MFMTRTHTRAGTLAGLTIAAGVALLTTTATVAQADIGDPDPDTGSSWGTRVAVGYQDGDGNTEVWMLDCEAGAGNHPDPDEACAALEANGAEALAPTPPNQPCTLQYGGPQTAQVTGTLRGQPVVSWLSREDGCEIERWDALVGLLPEH